MHTKYKYFRTTSGEIGEFINYGKKDKKGRRYILRMPSAKLVHFHVKDLTPWERPENDIVL